MSINLHNKNYLEFFKYLGWILLFIFLWFSGCSNGSKTTTNVKVTSPAVIGKFEPKKPEIKTFEIEEKDGVFLENPINEKLLIENTKLKSDFDCLSDSLQKLAYRNAIQLNEFSSNFEDENVIIGITGVVQGEVKQVAPTYTWKEKQINIPIRCPETTFRLLAGLEIGNNTQFNNSNIKANFMLQNKKGNSLTISRDTQKNYWIGFYGSIFNIKR